MLKEVEKDQVEIVDQTKVEKKQQFVGSLKMQPNHVCWEYNVTTNELNFAKFQESQFDLHTGKPLFRKVIVSDECLYLSALNKKNAIKKLCKILQKEVVPEKLENIPK
jgi:hypothetical protein